MDNPMLTIVLILAAVCVRPARRSAVFCCAAWAAAARNRRCCENRPRCGRRWPTRRARCGRSCRRPSSPPSPRSATCSARGSSARRNSPNGGSRRLRRATNRSSRPSARRWSGGSSQLQADNNEKLDQMRVVGGRKAAKDARKQDDPVVPARERTAGTGLQGGWARCRRSPPGVGDLKRVLSGVKTRGILGETQLGAILEEILSPNNMKRTSPRGRAARNAWNTPCACPATTACPSTCPSTQSSRRRLFQSARRL